MTTRHHIADAATTLVAASLAAYLADQPLPTSIAIAVVTVAAWGAGRASGWIAALRYATTGGER